MILIILLTMTIVVVPAYAVKGGKPKLPQGIKAIADNGDFLGILVNIALEPDPGPYNVNTELDRTNGITTYIPSLNKFLELRSINDIASARTRVDLYFSKFGCEGTAYLATLDATSIFIVNHPEFLWVNQNTFYEQVGDPSSTPYGNASCSNTGSSS
jgi:hypothetical protein